MVTVYRGNPGMEDKMTVSFTTTFHGDNSSAPENAVKATQLWLKFGAASAGGSMVFSGDHVGEAAFTVVFADWESFGRGMELRRQDKEFNTLMAGVLAATSVSSRTVLVSFS